MPDRVRADITSLKGNLGEGAVPGRADEHLCGGSCRAIEEVGAHQIPAREVPPVIEFPTVTREIRSLLHRRRLLMTFLGSLFAATGLFLHNVLRGRLPDAMQGIKEY